MGISAKAVNSETWSDKLVKVREYLQYNRVPSMIGAEQEIKELKYQAIFMAPEMCSRHAGGKELLVTLGAAEKIFAFVIDEAHCISQWGGEFRPAYAELQQLRAYVPPSIPVMLSSATFSPATLEDCEKSVLIRPEHAFYVNLGNDRKNIKVEVRTLKNATDFEALDDVFNFASIHMPSDIPKTLVFANTRAIVQQLWRYIRLRLDPHLHYTVDFMHGLRSKRGKRQTMNRFVTSEVRILIATEAVGMVRENQCPGSMHFLTE